MGPNAFLYKTDLDSFRNLRVDPATYTFFGLKWNDVIYDDVSRAFGLKKRSCSLSNVYRRNYACIMWTRCVDGELSGLLCRGSERV